MKTHLLLTITCPDRPGVIERVTEVTVAHGANWEASRMARLGGEFAGMVLISVDAQRAPSLADALRAMSDEQMTVVVKPTATEADAPASDALFDLRLRGADHEGIVHKVAAYLARQGINVEEMRTEVVPAPMSASPLFEMEARLRVPLRLPESELQEGLQQIADQLGVDIELEAASATP